MSAIHIFGIFIWIIVIAIYLIAALDYSGKPTPLWAWPAVLIAVSLGLSIGGFFIYAAFSPVYALIFGEGLIPK